MSKEKKYVDISIIEEIIEQTYHEILLDADKFRDFSKEILRKCESNSYCNEIKISRIKKLLKKYYENPEKYKDNSVIEAIDRILSEK